MPRSSTSFKPGDPRINRKGRPKKGQSVTDILNWELDQKRTFLTAESEKIGVIKRQVLAKKLLAKAIDEGDFAAMRYVIDRVDGTPKQSIDVSAEVQGMEFVNDSYEENEKRALELMKELGFGGHRQSKSK
jgi:hypothetical protein